MPKIVKTIDIEVTEEDILSYFQYSSSLDKIILLRKMLEIFTKVGRDEIDSIVQYIRECINTKESTLTKSMLICSFVEQFATKFQPKEIQ